MLATNESPRSIESLISSHNAKDLLKFITCGNVDDGKSTLIGRLLLDAGAIYDDQIEALKSESTKHGTTGAEIDTALLLDGLEDERQQGITIDVAYRYFSTEYRKFIIADTPGHEQFTRNMATGASTADLAVILVDATKGITTQTKRHAFIVSLLGIKQVVLAVNKMDLLDFDQITFERIRDEFKQFTEELPAIETVAIPLSALKGSNVVQPSEQTPWYSGLTLLGHLNSVTIDSSAEKSELRFPVQWVNRPSADFRGFSGTIASGTVRVGDEVMVLPSKKRSRVKSIVTMDGDLTEAVASDSITVTLEDEIDITRGDMLVPPDASVNSSQHITAKLVWMSSQALVPGKSYWLKHASQRNSCEVQSIHYEINVNTLQRKSASSLALNEIGLCELKLHHAIFHDSYRSNRETGSFILVDRVTHETVAAGMIEEISGKLETAGHWGEQSSTIAPRLARGLVSAESRQEKYGHKPFTVLITGFSGSGKTSVAMELERRLFEDGRHCLVLDGQTLRLGISRDLGFSAEERSENLRRAAEIAKLTNDSGQICIAAFVAPSDWVRQKARDLVGADRFLHVHLATSVEVCRERDITGQYQAADDGRIASFPGVTFDYEQPQDADLVVDTEDLSVAEIATQVLALFLQRSWLS